MGFIQNIRASRKAQQPSREPDENRNPDLRNWGSLSSELGSMRWDSIRSVNEFFNSRSAGAKAAPDAANRPKMSIQGRGPRRRVQDDPLRMSMRQTNAEDILRAILAEKVNSQAKPKERHSLPELRSHKSSESEGRNSLNVDVSTNRSIDLRSTGSSMGSPSPGATMEATQDADAPAGGDAGASSKTPLERNSI